MQTSSPLSVSQEMLSNNDTMQDMKPIVSGIQPPVRPTGPANMNILNNLSQARLMNPAALSGGTSMGLPAIGVNPMAMHMSNMISSGMASSAPVAQTVISSGQSGMQSGITSIPGSAQSTVPIPVPVPSSFTSATSNMSGSSTQPLGAGVGVGVGMGQPVSGMSQGNLAGLQMGMNQNMMSGANQSGMPGPGTGNGTGAGSGMMPTPGMAQQQVQGMQTLGVNSNNNNTAANVALGQQTAGALQSAQSKYVKVWEVRLIYKFFPFYILS